TTDGSGKLAAPDLAAVGDKFPRRELIDAVLRPSANIAVGYETTIVTTKGGDALVGVVKESADDHVALMGADGKLERVATNEIRSRRTQPTASIMPQDLETGL